MKFLVIRCEASSSCLNIILFLGRYIMLATSCTLADYNTRPPDTILSNFINALPVVCHFVFMAHISGRFGHHCVLRSIFLIAND